MFSGSDFPSGSSRWPPPKPEIITTAPSVPFMSTSAATYAADATELRTMHVGKTATITEGGVAYLTLSLNL